MSHATSNWIIIVCVTIFMVVGVIGNFAGYAYQSSVAANGSVVEFTPTGAYIVITIPFIGNIPLDFSWIPGAGALAGSLDFLYNILVFSVPGIPYWLSMFFWFLTFILTVAVTRVVLGAVGGGS